MNQLTLSTRAAPGDPRSMRRAALASVIGSIVEWYDFYLYGTAAALIFNQLFFPNFDPVVGTLLAFSTYALGFFVRPIGGVVFGHLGDRLGRKKVLVITLLLMGGATTMIGAVPTYGTIGIWAPILLLLLRMVQGAAAGAEFTGAVLLIGEFSPRDRRGFFTSLPGAGISIGILAAAGVFAIFSALPQDQFEAWGWRVPFLLSAGVVILGLVVRMAVPETPEFERLIASEKAAKRPIAELVKTQPKELLLALGIRIAENGSAYLLQVFVLTYLATHAAVSTSVGLVATLVAAGLCVVAIPLFGRLSDRIGARWVYLFGAGFFALFAFPYFAMLDSGNAVLAVVGVVISVVFSYGAMVGSQPSLLISLFPPRHRFSGISIAREFSAPIAGGLAPLIATALIAAADGSSRYVALYMMLLGCISVACILALPRVLAGDQRTKPAMSDDLAVSTIQGDPA